MTILNYILVFLLSASGYSSGFADESKCVSRPEGPAIDWSPEFRLAWSDFRAEQSRGRGNAVAASTCGFGYEGIVQGDQIRVNVYVRFYCEESWHNNNYRLDEILAHEQLHFDICELYGRILYNNIVDLRKRGQLTEKNLGKTLKKLRDEYDQVQEKYDRETSHSMNSEKQVEWRQRIDNALKRYSNYADYTEF